MNSILVKTTTSGKLFSLLTGSLNVNSLLKRQSVTSIVTFKKKSAAENVLSADNKTKHAHKIKEICENDICEQKKCPALCAQLKRSDTKGHFTHKPVAGKFCRFVSETDMKQNLDSQYYVKNNDQSKQADAVIAKDYYKNKEVIPNVNGQQFLQIHENKLND